MKPHGWIYDEVAAYIEGKKQPPTDDVKVFEWRPDDMGAELVDWNTANPSMGMTVTPGHVAALRRLMPRLGPDELVVLDEVFVLDDWQRRLLLQLFGKPTPNGFQIGSRGQMVLGPVGATSEQLAQQLIDRSIWDDVPRTPRADPEMLNRVIDDIATDVTAKIARTECPKFPRAE